MTLNEKTVLVKKGTHLTIPKGTIHSVDHVISRKPFVVVSIQLPFFDGKDRVFVNEHSKNK
jgi:mannose-6-phosphate isomerase-like protein (cupin superfamily)